MPHSHQNQPPIDLLVIGGGINGCGIARDAVGRGLSVMLCEMGDLGQATSSASTKLFHGGLRYLEYFQFRLVREALAEREVLLRNMPHISWPMRFVLPLYPNMRFDSETPASRLLAWVAPWAKGRRPAWLMRLGLFLYDHLAQRQTLPATRRLALRNSPEGAPLQPQFSQAFEYSDCWVQDSRLVSLNARDAAARGAKIHVRTRVVAAQRSATHWDVTLENTKTGTQQVVQARMLVNAAGPWAAQVLGQVLHLNSPDRLRLVRGSHIVTRRLFAHEKAYFFQGSDGRIIFAIPYEQEFTLIGTTDANHDSADTAPECTEAEQDYLLAFAGQYFKTPLSRADIVWQFSGMRPLHDDGGRSASAVTRDYSLKLDDSAAPVLHIFGGKITTYRRLAEKALAQILPALGHTAPNWTHDAPLPGGAFAVGDAGALVAELAARYPFLGQDWATRLVRAYGLDAQRILGPAKQLADLGTDFGATLTQAEVDWLVAHEFAQSADDILWRRTRLGLKMPAKGRAALETYLQGLDGGAKGLAQSAA